MKTLQYSRILRNALILCFVLTSSAWGYNDEVIEWITCPTPKFEKERKAAEKGDPKAQLNIAMNYHYAHGVDQDLEKAAHWYGKAAEQGNVEAQTSLGSLYTLGMGVPWDYSKANFWLLKAAKQGHAESQEMLAFHYYKGEGLPDSDFAESARWMQKAAEQGLASAQYNLATNHYFSGTGLPKDTAAGVHWLRKAAGQGIVSAYSLLGSKYAAGKGIPQDLIQAYVWLLLGSEADNYGTKPEINLNVVKKQMNAKQIAEASRIVVTWREKLQVKEDYEEEDEVLIRCEKAEE